MRAELKGRWHNKKMAVAERQERLRAQISPPTVDSAPELLYLATASGEILQLLPPDEDEPTQDASDE
jgi:lysophospholipase L1-like esterase